jgi:hypothetical protein
MASGLRLNVRPGAQLRRQATVDGTSSNGARWHQDFARAHGVQEISKFSSLLLNQAQHEAQDLHWHALDDGLSVRAVIAAAMFSGTEIDILKHWSPDTGQTGWRYSLGVQNSGMPPRNPALPAVNEREVLQRLLRSKAPVLDPLRGWTVCQQIAEASGYAGKVIHENGQ